MPVLQSSSKARAVIVSALMMMSLVMASCSATPPAMPTGEWEGSVTSSNGTSLPLLITFKDVCQKGDVCATVTYASLGCDSDLTYARQKGDEMVFKETITYGTFCKKDRTIYMKYVDNNTPLAIRIIEQDGDEGPSGLVNYGRIPLPTEAPIAIPGFGREVYSFQNLGLYVNWRAVLADGSLWIPDSDSGNLIRIDVTTNQIVATIKVGNPEANRSDGYDPNSVAVSGDQVWVTQRATRSVGRIDPVTNTLVESVELPNTPYDMVIDGEMLWMTSFDGDTVMRMDLNTREIKSVYVNKPIGIAVGSGSVWAVEHRNGNLVRIDPQTAEFVARIDLNLPAPAPQAQPEEVIFAEGSVWVANNGGQNVSRVDAVTNKLIATISLGGRYKPQRLVAGGGFIWVEALAEIGSDLEDIIAVIDPSTNTVARTVVMHGHVGGTLIYDDGFLWVFDAHANNDKRAGDRIFKIELDK